MHMAHIDRIDLNLIPPLVALIEEKHVSRAAERGHRSPTARKHLRTSGYATSCDQRLVNAWRERVRQNRRRALWIRG